MIAARGDYAPVWEVSQGASAALEKGLHLLPGDAKKRPERLPWLECASDV